MKKFIILASLTLSTILSNSQTMEDSTVIAFASDTQAPMWVETLWLRSHNNRTATKMLFEDISRRNPKSLFLLGDVVNLGYSERQWKPIDRYLSTLRKEGTEVHAILGNHEVMGQAKRGQEKFQKRFPNHKATGYVEVVDSIAVVLLNSNFKTLSKEENAQQLKWYEETLHKLDADPSIEYIITACHHSPFTNSKIVGCSEPVQQKFVPPFLKSKKSQLFLSGHSHNFEHYQVGGKDFFVIGGGGGLHQPLKSGNGVLPELACDYKPLFHYLTVKRNADGLQLTSYKVNDSFNNCEEGFTMQIATKNESVATK